MGFNAKNSYILALMTIAFIVGEIAHFLLGKISFYFLLNQCFPTFFQLAEPLEF